MSYSDSEEDEDVKVRRKLDRKERIEQDPISINQTLLDKSNLTQAELKEIQEIFQLVDLDHSGAIDHNELMSLMNTLGLHFNVSEIENIISEADSDNTGEIDFESFVLTVSKKVATQYTRQTLLSAFKRCLRFVMCMQ